jgi:hypothetical protein
MAHAAVTSECILKLIDRWTKHKSTTGANGIETGQQFLANLTVLCRQIEEWDERH